MGAKARGHRVQSQRGALDRGQQVDLLCLRGQVLSPQCECVCVCVLKECRDDLRALETCCDLKRQRWE